MRSTLVFTSSSFYFSDFLVDTDSEWSKAATCIGHLPQNVSPIVSDAHAICVDNNIICLRL